MGTCLQEALEGKGLEKVNIVRLENVNNGALGVIGYDKQSVKYRLHPAKDKSIAAMAWPGTEGTDRGRIRQGVMNLLALRATQNINGDLFVGPAVDYSDPKEVKIDETGAALWKRVV